MKTKLLLVLLIVAISASLFGCSKSEEKVDKSDFIKSADLISKIEKADLNEKEKFGLVQMREEEKLARDVYSVLYDKWGQHIFNNIAQSEQTHTDAIKSLLTRYEIADPVTNDEVGVFTSSALQTLYDDLIKQGEESLIEALKVGATIEDLDIKDLESFMEVTDNEDILVVYQNLAKGSRNHLRAFTKNIKRQNGSYEAQYISEKQYSDIIGSANERGVIYKGANKWVSK